MKYWQILTFYLISKEGKGREEEKEERREAKRQEKRKMNRKINNFNN